MSFAYSTNEEDYHGGFPTREAAIEDAVASDDLAPGDTVWTGKVVSAGPASRLFRSVRRIIEDMQEDAYDEAGEHADRFLENVTDAQVDELGGEIKKVIDAWADKHGLQPTFFTVASVEKHAAPAAEIVSL